MSSNINEKLIHILNDNIENIALKDNEYRSLLDKIGNAHFVLIGEATHGTHEFYQTRADITKQLILKKGFQAIAIEGDWPDTYQIHRYIKGSGDKSNWRSSLDEFKRFPAWMWRNTTLVPFIQWLREYNDALNSSDHKIGFYGLDLYSLNSSMQAVVDYLSKVDTEAANRARLRYACFDHLTIDPQKYGYLTSSGFKKSCLHEAIDQVLEMQRHAFKYINQNDIAGDEFFYASQNAQIVKDSEHYYRSMFEGRISSWNIRDIHMVETLNAISAHLENKFDQPAKIVVWAHNSHVGDARATEMGDKGEVNLGQLTREHHGAENCYLIGQSTYEGFVTAADDWDMPAQRKPVSPGFPGSYEELFHHLNYKKFLLDLDRYDEIEHYLHLSRLQRAIGVIYRPDTERYSHYFFTRLPYQFDCLIHTDKTSALQPLDVNPEWKQ